MSTNDLADARGVISNYHLLDSKWYTTQSNDEVILFKDKSGDRKTINDWIIFANTTELKIQIVRTVSDVYYPESETVDYESDTIIIEAGANWSNGKIPAHGIKVLGASGQDIRYIGNYY